MANNNHSISAALSEHEVLSSVPARAENGTRTRDILLGKQVLYQLSYFRKCVSKKNKCIPIPTCNASLSKR